MAISKIGSKALVDGTIDATEIQDGSVTSNKIAPASITAPKLQNSSVTINGSSISLGGSISIPNLSWQSVITADGSTVFTAVSGNGYFVDTTSGTVTINLPSSPSTGDFIAIKDYAGTFLTNNVTIQGNGNIIQGDSENDAVIRTNRASVILVYVDATKGWLFTRESNVSDLTAQYISATGGTVTESGDYKIHTFTGDGCFVVSCGGNPGGSDTVDYLVVAGGGAGGTNAGGGGGAGGLRTASCFSVSTTTYPITVGAGGTNANSSNSCRGGPGSNSSFSTITSTGGGGGATNPTSAGLPGGSGGGGASCGPGPGGTGNTPPVSPPQGNNGGSTTVFGGSYAAGGGGGASAVGGSASPASPAAGAGGAGTQVTATFGCSPQPFYQTDVPTNGTTSTGYFAGGGGGGSGSSGTVGNGGIGGGGKGAKCSPGGGPEVGSAGTTNSGGGGGGGFQAVPGLGGYSGGKGIVIIRYKYQ